MKSADAIVIGAGVMGLCTATALSKRGVRAMVIGESRPGEASSAAAGMLAPSVEKSDGPAHRFAIAARDLYPDYLEGLADSTGIRVALNRLGVLQVALTEKGVTGLRKTAGSESEWIERAQLTEMEPTLGHALGAVFNPGDGAVDNIALMLALSELAAATEGITAHVGAARRLLTSDQNTVTVETAAGEKFNAAHVVLCPGAWGRQIEGAGALHAVTPSRGQLVSYAPIGLRHVTYGPRGYLVPRSPGSLIAGSTMENVGFSAETTPDGLARVRSAASEIAPALGVAEVRRSWAGLRPVTPDMLPLLGPSADNPRILFACGHSRNGILLAPLTGETVAALVTGERVAHDLSQFRPDRF